MFPLALLLLATAAQPAAAPGAIWISRSAELALACVHKEYPNKIAHVLNGDADVKAPRELTPGARRNQFIDSQESFQTPAKCLLLHRLLGD